MDRLYNALFKKYGEEYALNILNGITEMGFAQYICITLKSGMYLTVADIFDNCKDIKVFRDIIVANIHAFLMASLTEPHCMTLVLFAEEELVTNKVKTNITSQMALCAIRHGLVYPQNRKYCFDFAARYLDKTNVLNRSYFYMYDYVEHIYKYFDKSPETKAMVTQMCMDSDASDTLMKALKYFQLPTFGLCKLSIIEFEKNISKLNLEDEDVRHKIITEACSYSRWEMLPFIFDNFKLNEDDWLYIQHGLYRGNYSLPFVQALFHFMEINEYQPKLLFNSKFGKLYLTDEIKGEFLKRGMEEYTEIGDSKLIIEHVKNDIANLFTIFRDRSFDQLVNHMLYTNAHKNGRFIRERNYVNTLIKGNLYGWTSELKISWIAFYSFTEEIIRQLDAMEQVTLHYNSFFAISEFAHPMLAVRCMNTVYKLMTRVQSKIILDNYASMIQFFEKLRCKALQGVREIIGVVLAEDEDWIVPENYTLEDLFKELYQYSCLTEKNQNDETDGYNRLITALEKKKYVKIADEVRNAWSCAVPVNDVLDILRRKNVV